MASTHHIPDDPGLRLAIERNCNGLTPDSWLIRRLTRSRRDAGSLTKWSKLNDFKF